MHTLTHSGHYVSTLANVTPDSGPFVSDMSDVVSLALAIATDNAATRCGTYSGTDAEYRLRDELSARTEYGYVLYDQFVSYARGAVEAWRDYAQASEYANALWRAYVTERDSDPNSYGLSAVLGDPRKWHARHLASMLKGVDKVRRERDDARALALSCLARIAELDASSAAGEPFML
jgi:hypothetical protein